MKIISHETHTLTYQFGSWVEETSKLFLSDGSQVASTSCCERVVFESYGGCPLAVTTIFFGKDSGHSKGWLWILILIQHYRVRNLNVYLFLWGRKSSGTGSSPASVRTCFDNLEIDFREQGSLPRLSSFIFILYSSKPSQKYSFMQGSWVKTQRKF